MTILIIEDDPIYLQILEIYCQKFGRVFSIDTLRSLNEVIASISPDIIIADIFIEKESSLAYFKKFGAQNAPILFISNSESLDQIMESLEIPYSLFLKKPIEPISLEIHFKYLLREYKKEHIVPSTPAKSGIMVRGKFNQELCIPYSDILYVESDRNYITLHLISGKVSSLKYSLNKLMEECPPHFIRISKSIVINVFSSSKWRANPLYFYFDKKTFSIGKIYQENVIKQLKSLFLPFEFEEF